MELRKEAFLTEFGDLYGYPTAPKGIDQIRATEFKRLPHGSVYLDHAGATLYSELQMEEIFKDLSTNVYGNPHSQSDSSSATSDTISRARQLVLDHCKASPKDYTCVFTSGSTAALKLVGEAFLWSSQSCFAYTMENHNSVLGIREYALARGASAFAVDVEEVVDVPDSNVTSMRLSQRQIQRRNDVELVQQQDPKGETYNLFAFPSECNFSGLRFNLELVRALKERGSILEGSPFHNKKWMVLIDAAKGCTTEPPDLSQYPADFVVLSFYKLFGYPTGLGALIIRNDAAKLLKKSYFSGGTVDASIADIDFVKRRNGVAELFEDGTVSFLSIASILHGFKIINSLSISAVTEHITSLVIFVRKVLLSLRHENGASVCTLYGIQTSKVSSHKSGSVISFNLKRPDGSWFGYREVEKLASLSGIQLRTGCFCNPGACAKYLGLSHADLFSNVEAGHVCWDDFDIVNGKPTGAVRISFGYMSTYEDAKMFIEFITRSFMALPNRTARISKFLQGDDVRLPRGKVNIKSIIIYPIKSCEGFNASSWPLCSTGLLYDREWVLTSPDGEILTQKKVPEMCFISTLVDLDFGKLFVESPRCKARLQISLNSDSRREEITIHGRRYEVQDCDNEVNSWFTYAIGRPCTLSRLSSSSYNLCLNNSKTMGMCRVLPGPLSFTNEAQFLLISEESVSDLNDRIGESKSLVLLDGCTEFHTVDREKFKFPNDEAFKDYNLVSVSGAYFEDAQDSARVSLPQVNSLRFRPNLVVSGDKPYAEDGWRNIRIGRNYFTSLGGCNRCQMINIVRATGNVQKSTEPLSTLASYRRVKGKILFGILLKYEKSDEVRDHNEWLHVGEEIHPNGN